MPTCTSSEEIIQNYTHTRILSVSFTQEKKATVECFENKIGMRQIFTVVIDPLDTRILITILPLLPAEISRISEDHFARTGTNYKRPIKYNIADISWINPPGISHQVSWQGQCARTSDVVDSLDSTVQKQSTFGQSRASLSPVRSTFPIICTALQASV